MKQLSAVVLAAGEGKRMRSEYPKVLHPVCGRPMLGHVLEGVSALTDCILIVVGHGAPQVQEALGPSWRYVLQEKRLGTGHALAQALPELPKCGNLLVLCGDTPLITSHHLQEMLETHISGGATVMTARVPDPSGYGRIIRDTRDQVTAIVEDSEADPGQKAINEINTGTYCFDLKLLAGFLSELERNNEQQEYYLTDVISLFKKYGHPVQSYLLPDYRVGIGVNDRSQLAEAAAIWRERINREHMLNGVAIVDPQTTYIDYGVEIGPETVIWPQTTIEGPCTIGSHCRIGPGVYLKQMELGDRVVIRYAVAEQSRIETGAVLGPYANIRPGCNLGRQVKIGDFVEVKNSNIGEGTKVPHLSYVGDADIGKGSNLGAGVIVVNYDGRRKHRCLIESGAFVGCNSNLVSPLTIGEGAFIGAGSTIVKDVPAGSLALARAEQNVYPGRASRLIARKVTPEKDNGLHQDTRSHNK